VKKLPIRDHTHTIIAYALVDDEDYSKTCKYYWYYNDCRKYVCGEKYIPVRRHEKIYLSHMILGKPSTRREVVVYKNGNVLDNRKNNLEVISKSKQCARANKQASDTSSKYKGVWWDSRCKQWVAELRHNNRRVLFKRFDDEIEAAKARDEKLKEIYGSERVFLNFQG